MVSGFVFLLLGSGCLEHLIVLSFPNALFDEPLTVTATFLILVFTGSRLHFMTSGPMHRIPAFGLGCGFEDCLVRVHVRSAGQFPSGLIEIRFRKILHGMPIDQRQFSRTLPHHVIGYRTDAG